MSEPLAGPSELPSIPRSISGTTPGILDPSQPARLLRLPASKLSFADFDPSIAHVNPASPGTFPTLQNLSLAGESEQYRPKRIVIETTPEGKSFWRFVPRARREDDVSLHDEGSWPRVVEICGERVQCTQDQWDIYKLDSEYDCLIQSSPNLSVITKVPPRSTTEPTVKEMPFGKRQPPSPQLDIPISSPHKKMRRRSVSVHTNSSSSSAEGDMSIDEKPRFRSKSAGVGRRARKVREEQEKNRAERREKIKRFQAMRELPVEDDKPIHPEEVLATPKQRFQSVPSENASKRKVSTLDPSIHSPQNQRQHDIQKEKRSDSDRTKPPVSKRTRTTSPESIRRIMENKRTEREKNKHARLSKVMQSRKADRDRWLHHNAFEDVPESHFETYDTSAFDPLPRANSFDQNGFFMEPNDDTKDPEHEDEQRQEVEATEEHLRRSALAESIRKLKELEKDKPLWDEAAKKRRQRETAEEDERRAKAEERRQEAAQQAELERRVKAENAEREAMVRADAEWQKREATAKRAKEKRRERQRWQSGPWTTSRALDCYKTLCQSFDSEKFSPAEPLTFEDVPWPVLHAPGRFTVEDVDWTAVERFFEAVKPYVRGDEYKTLVEKSHRRFHPDRWRSRRLLASIADEGDRECIEVAANCVAQALTPMWRNLKGR